MSCQPLQHLGETDENGFQRITSPELFSSDETVSAIQFRPDTRHESVTVRLGGGKVKVWKPGHHHRRSNVGVPWIPTWVLKECRKK